MYRGVASREDRDSFHNITPPFSRHLENGKFGKCKVRVTIQESKILKDGIEFSWCFYLIVILAGLAEALMQDSCLMLGC